MADPSPCRAHLDADLPAGAAISLEQLVLVLVGDKQSVLEQLKGLDIPPAVEMAASGEVKLRN